MAAEGKPTILIVEDDAGIAELEKYRLEEAGYQIDVAANAHDAIQIVRAKPVDLILLDYRLPGDVDGLTFFDQIQKDGFDIPVILVTGFSNEATVIRALRAGVRDFVTKSVEYLDYLPEAVGRVLRQTQTESRLANSEARLASIINSAKDAILVTESDQKITLFNPAAEQMFRCSAAEAIGQRLSRFIPPEHVEAFQDHAGDPVSMTLRIRTGTRGIRANGEEFPLEASASRGQMADRKLYSVVVRDITERKRAEEALRQSEERFRNAFDHTNVAMVLTDLDNRFVRVNDAFARTFGYSREEILPLSMADITHPEDVAESLARRKALLAGEIPFFQIEKRYLHKDGRVLWGLTNVSLLRAADGSPSQYVGQLQDITERKTAEAANARYIERLRILHQIDKALIAGEGPAAIAAAALAPLRELLGVARAIVNLFDLAKGEVEWLAAAGRHRVHVGPGVRYSIRLMGDVEALQRGELQSIDVHALPPSPEVDALLASGVHAYAVVPMIAEGELIGALSLGGASLPLSTEQVSVAREAATQFAIALAQARLHERVKRQAQELEVRLAERKQAEAELRSTHEKLHQLLAHSPAVLYTLAIEGAKVTPVVVSDNIERLLGVTVPETSYDWWQESLHPRDRDRVLADFATGLAQGGYSMEYRVRHKDGSYRWVEDNNRVLRGDSGQPKEAVGVWTDVTERKRTEGRMMAQHAVTRVLAASPSLADASAQILQAICECLDWELGILWHVDQTANVLRCVQIWHPPLAQCAVFEADCRKRAFIHGIGLPGRVLSSVKAAWIPDVVHDNNFPRAPLAAQAGLHAAFGFPIILGNEVLGVLEFFSHEFRQPDEDVLKMMTAIGSQIGQFIERKRAEQAQHDSNQKLRLLIQVSPLAIVALDGQGNVLMWNPAAERIFGWTEAEVLGRPTPIIPANQQQEFRARIEDVLGGKTHDAIEVTRLHKNGSLVESILWTAPIRDSRGEIASVLLFLADNTERKSLEEQFRQAQKMEAIGVLASGVAHDFNNLLTIISGYSEMLLSQTPPDAKAHGPLSEIHRAGERAAGLTRQLLAFSRKQILSPQIVNLNSLVAETEKMLTRIIGADIDMAKSLDPSLWPVKADPGQIEQVILNLIVNARDAMPKGGQITVETRNTELNADYSCQHVDVKEGQFVVLAVTDTGTGMDAETKSRIFEPFFTTKDVGKGTGLGLATVHGIVKQSGGHIEVYSELGRGTSFKIYLPRIEGTPTDRSALTTAPVPNGNETILLVEDGMEVLELARTSLTSRGYTVLPASNGEQALKIVSEHAGPIDLLVTDVVMPRMSGRELAEKLMVDRPGLKVLYMSGYTDDAIVRHGVLQSGVAFLQKPFTPVVFARKVREVIGPA